MLSSLLIESMGFATGFDHLGPASIKPLQFSYWVGVAEALEAMGVEVLIGRVPASASIEERAKVLCEMIGERFPGREVNLIGHSMVSYYSFAPVDLEFVYKLTRTFTVYREVSTDVS